MAKTYRPDIDGLRALSVILVILFHFGSPAASGGFVGVDVFFVISGYLITSILLNAIYNKNFSVISFYERRIRRIVPALLTTVVLCLAAGYFLLTPGDYKTLGHSALSTIFAVSNIFFCYNTGYFDINSEFMPLLHTWSLGVEEQFYVVWPLLIAVVARVSHNKKSTMFFCFLAVIALSFSCNLWQTALKPKSAFFLPFSRAWELAIGGLLVLLPRRPLPPPVSEAIPALGVLLIVFTSLHLTQQDPFPGGNAVAPVLGAACFLYHDGSSLVGKLFSLRPLAGIGKISYSLYLCHWPVLAFWRQFAFGDKPSETVSILLGLLMLVLATASYFWVEQPFRRTSCSTSGIYIRGGWTIAAVAVAALLVSLGNGLPQRLSPSMRAISSLDIMWQWPCQQVVSLPVAPMQTSRQPRVCAVGAPWETASRRAIIWGDSNAEHFIPLFDIAGRAQDVSIALIGPCPGIINNKDVKTIYAGSPQYSEQCGQQQKSVLQMLHDRPDINLVILSARWSSLAGCLYGAGQSSPAKDNQFTVLRNGLAELLDAIGPNKKIVIINDIPTLPFPNPAQSVLARNSYLVRRQVDQSFDVLCWDQFQYGLRPIHEAIRSVAADRVNVMVLNPEDALCAGGRCRTWLNGEFLYRDEAHFRRNLTQTTESQLAQALGFDKALAW